MTKHLKSIKRVLAQTFLGVVTVKDTEGNLWIIKYVPQTRLSICVNAMDDSKDAPFNILNHLHDDKTTARILAAVEKLDAAFWNDALYDYEQEKDKVTLMKKSVEALSIGFSYGVLHKEDIKRLRTRHKV